MVGAFRASAGARAACRVTVARLADANPGLFWISWESNQDAFAAPSRDYWQNYPPAFVKS